MYIDGIKRDGPAPSDRPGPRTIRQELMITMNRTKTLITAASLAAAMILVGCAPSVQTTDRAPATQRPEPAVTTTQRATEPSKPVASEPQVIGGENVEAYFEALGTHDPRDMKTMLDLAADDSPAQVYAKVQYLGVIAEQQSYGTSMTGPQTMRITDNGDIELSSQPMGYEGDIEETLVYTGFELTDGKLASFSIIPPEGGDPISIDNRIVHGGQKQQIAGNTVRLAGAYHSIQGDKILVAISTDASGDSIEYGYENTYETADGRQVAAVEYLGDDTPRRGREGPYVVIFDQVDLGGTAFIEVYDADYDSASLRFDLEPIG